jgi:anhydro-N-acetylmuramic acid kinase
MTPARYVGAISGTSIDGLDLALIEVATSVSIIAGTTVPFDAALRDRLIALASSETNDVDSFGRADTMLGTFIARSIVDFLLELRLSPLDIRAIGSHGQTVRHRPEPTARYTLQLGDPNIIAEDTGILTVADFRRRDLAAGGEGAPLVPLFHASVFGSPADMRTVLNIGGIANITTLSRDSDHKLSGFDTGPGNTLLDAWVRFQRGESFDYDGSWACSGTVHPELLRALLADPYFRQPPPKSTGREKFDLNWLRRHLHGLDPMAPADVQATLSELTAQSVAEALPRWGHPSGTIIVVGGGRLNIDLMNRLRRLAPNHVVRSSEDCGVNGDWVEAAAFAWLACRTLAGLAGNAPEVTGARAARVLGGVYASASTEAKLR